MAKMSECGSTRNGYPHHFFGFFCKYIHFFCVVDVEKILDDCYAGGHVMCRPVAWRHLYVVIGNQNGAKGKKWMENPLDERWAAWAVAQAAVAAPALANQVNRVNEWPMNGPNGGPHSMGDNIRHMGEGPNPPHMGQIPSIYWSVRIPRVFLSRCMCVSLSLFIFTFSLICSNGFPRPRTAC